jgi:hypothetical protein
MKKVLVVQFPCSSAEDFELLLAIEETLIQAFSQNNYAVVDGHDVGEGRFNIFIHPSGAWQPVIERVHAFLKLKSMLTRALIAKGLKSERWQVIWPEGHTAKFEL